MKNLLKNALLTVLLAYAAFTLLQGQHGAIFIPFVIMILGTLLTAGTLQTQREQA